MTITKIQSEGLAKPVDLADNEQIRLGTGNDLKLYHGGTNSIIQNDTGDLYQKNANNLFIQVNGNEAAIYARTNGSVELYYDNVKHFETISAGLNFAGSNADQLQWQKANNLLKFRDGTKAVFGEGDDLQIHGGEGGTGAVVNSANGDLFFRHGSEEQLILRDDGNVELYSDNVKTFSTKSGGNTLYGTDASGNVSLGRFYYKQESGTVKALYDPYNSNFQLYDSVKATFGNDHDLKILHDGSHSYVHNAGTGNLRIRGDDVEITDNASNNNMARFIEGGAVELYYNNSKKLETANGGINITNSGAIYLGGTGSANALYDYEKGTFTPRFHGQGNNNTITTSTNIGDYVKIGRLVHVKIYVAFSDRNGANSVLAMDGLPFSNSGNYTTCNIGRWSSMQNNPVIGALVGHIGDGSQEIVFKGITQTGLENSDVNRTTDGTGVMLNFSYPAWGQ